MGKKRKGHGATKTVPPGVDVEPVEEITTCGCSHPLSQHTSEGCSAAGCDCGEQRELLIIGKVRAVDDL